MVYTPVLQRRMLNVVNINLPVFFCVHFGPLRARYGSRTSAAKAMVIQIKMYGWGR